MVPGKGCFHVDIAPVTNGAIVQVWLTARGLQVLQHHLYPPELFTTDLFYFPKAKKELAGTLLTQQTFRNTRDGVASKGMEDDLAVALERRFQWSNKCVQVVSDFVEKP